MLGPVPMLGTPYGAERPFWLTTLDVPCNAPPYGRIGAVDLNSGKLLWSHPFGTAKGSGPLGFKVPLAIPMGTPNYGGSLITASGIVFIGAAKDGYLRAYDLRTGRLLWHYELPGGGNSAPITYRIGNRQYLVIAAAGSNSIQSRLSTKLVAFAIPE